MKLIIISVRDIVADVFGTPQFVLNKGSAIRSFGDEVNRASEDNKFYQHPNDFELFCLGTYNDEDASFEIYAKPEQLILARDLVQKI